MDPYLQRRWGDIHSKLTAFIGETLMPDLPAGLRARTEERVLLEDDEGEPLNQWYRPDVSIVTARPFPADGAATLPEASLDADAGAVVEVELPPEPEVERWVQIIDVTAGNRVITAIEVLSPHNKESEPLNRMYSRKLNDYARGNVSVVEIDLLLGSRRRLAVRRERLPRGRRTPYVIAVRRAPIVERWARYPISVRAPIPPVRIPLRPTDTDVTLELQPLLRRVYQAGGHDDIDYRRDPEPALPHADAAWADEFLRAAGRR